MFGQMTAGSWIYIGSQGILQGTYETFAAAARRHFGGGLAGRLVLTAGLGGMAAPSARGTMTAAVVIAVEVDPDRIRRRLQTRYVDCQANGPDEALALARAALAEEGAPVDRTARERGRRADAFRGGPAPPRPGHGPDERPRSPERVCPPRTSVRGGAAAADLRAGALPRALEGVGGRTRPRMLALKKRGSVVFDYGNNIRQEAKQAGVADAFDIPGFVPEFIRPLFCEGKGPFRWAALSGLPEDIHRTDEASARDVPPGRGSRSLDPGWPATASPSRGCRRASAGWDTATGPGSA